MTVRPVFRIPIPLFPGESLERENVPFSEDKQSSDENWLCTRRRVYYVPGRDHTLIPPTVFHKLSIAVDKTAIAAPLSGYV